MSTRANIIIKDGSDEFYFYRHSDGYPEHAGVFTETTSDIKDVLDQDESDFLKEMETADFTYTIYDYRNNKMDLAEFQALTDEEKLCCFAVRPDGTLCDPAKYSKDILFEGIA